MDGTDAINFKFEGTVHLRTPEEAEMTPTTGPTGEPVCDTETHYNITSYPHTGDCSSVTTKR